MSYDAASYLGKTTEFPRSPFPAELGISPMVKFFITLNSRDVELSAGEPLFHLQKAFDLAPIRLEDYVEIRGK
jgi:hypothetical protein